MIWGTEHLSMLVAVGTENMKDWIEFTCTDESKVLFRRDAIVRIAPSMYFQGRMAIYEVNGICTPVMETYDEIKARLMHPHG